ncbi:Os08g0438801, partial [Oryza sativa Japonica Group]
TSTTPLPPLLPSSAAIRRIDTVAAPPRTSSLGAPRSSSPSSFRRRHRCRPRAPAPGDFSPSTTVRGPSLLSLSLPDDDLE